MRKAKLLRVIDIYFSVINLTFIIIIIIVIIISKMYFFKCLKRILIQISKCRFFTIYVSYNRQSYNVLNVTVSNYYDSSLLYN